MRKTIYKCIAVLAVLLSATFLGGGVLWAQPSESQTEAASEQTLESSETAATEEQSTQSTLPEETLEAEAEAPQTDVTVYNWQELKSALAEDNGYTHVTLGADITGEQGGIRIHAGKSRLTISGNGGGSVHTLTDYPQSRTAQAHMIWIQNPNMELLVQDLNIDGRNYFGTFTVLNSAANSGVSITYDRVNYTGPQMVYNRYGGLTLKDSSVNIRAITGGPAASELAEVARVDLAGRVSIDQQGPGATFWLLNNNRYIRVQDRAEVDIYTELDVFYIEGLGDGVSEYTPLTVGREAGLRMNVGTGVTRNDDHRLHTVTVEQGGSLIAHQRNSNGYITLAMNQALTLEPDSTLEITRTTNTSAFGLLGFWTPGATVTLNQPRRVKLFNPSGRLLKFTGTGGRLTGRVAAINTWQGNAFEDSLGNMPDHIWNKADFAPMELNASFSNLATQTATLDIDPERDPVISAFNTTSFDPSTQHTMVLGQHYLRIDSVFENSTRITGGSESGAAIRLDYDNQGTQRTLTGQAGQDGNYTIELPDAGLPLDMPVTAIGHRDYLKARQVERVQQKPPGLLQFLHVPPELAFERAQLSDQEQLIGRADPDWAIELQDTRGAGSGWKLEARITHPLQGRVDERTDTLDQALVFVDSNGQATPLSELPLPVWQGVTGENPVNRLSWAADRGLLVRLRPGQGRANVNYQTTVEWILSDAP